jgi:hypothetical protein
MAKRTIEAEFDEFGWQALEAEARRQDIPVEELLAYAAMYYLATASESKSIPSRALKLAKAGSIERH